MRRSTTVVEVIGLLSGLILLVGSGSRGLAPAAAQQVYRCVDERGNVYIGLGSSPVGERCAEHVIAGRLAPSKGDGGARSAAEAAEAARGVNRCKAAVLARLKAPATARFVSVYSDPGEQWVVGEVDARTSLGAPGRGSYACRMRRGAVEKVTVTIW